MKINGQEQYSRTFFFIDVVQSDLRNKPCNLVQGMRQRPFLCIFPTVYPSHEGG